MRVLLEHNNKYDYNDSHREGEDDITCLVEEGSTAPSKRRGNKKKTTLVARHRPHDVAILFARPLIEDQITIEYASRLISLAKAIKFENYRPEWICFCSSLGNRRIHYKQRAQQNSVSATAAGEDFFRQLCAANDIVLEGIGLCQISHDPAPINSGRHVDVDHDRNGDEEQTEGVAMNKPTPLPEHTQDSSELSSTLSSVSWSSSVLRPVVESLVDQGYLERWLDQSSVFESETDEYGMTRQDPRKKIQIHWTLFSTEYDLCNLNDIHIRSPRQSPLGMLAHDLEQAVSQKLRYRRGIVQTTWSFHYTIYPFVLFRSSAAASPEHIPDNDEKDGDLTAFLGKCFLMSQELVPLVVNLRGVAENVSSHDATSSSFFLQPISHRL
jgi:hypothetical protein